MRPNTTSEVSPFLHPDTQILDVLQPFQSCGFCASQTNRRGLVAPAENSSSARDREFAAPQILQSQRKSGLTGRTAAKAGRGQ